MFTGFYVTLAIFTELAETFVPYRFDAQGISTRNRQMRVKLFKMRRSSLLLQLQAYLLIVLLIPAAFPPSIVLAQPSVSITTPSNNANLAGTYTVTVMASAPNGVSFVELFYQQGGGVVQGEIAIWSKAPYTTNWDTTKVANGTYQLYAKAGDNTGNNATSAMVTVKIVNGAGAGTPVLSPGSGGLLILVLALVGIGGLILYRNRSRRNLKLPSAPATRQSNP